MKHSTLETGKSSKFSKAALLGLMALVSGLVSCSSNSNPYASRTYRIPWQDGPTGKYTLQEIEIKTLADPEGFKGSTATIWIEPTDRGGKVAGERPIGRFIRGSDGVIVPADLVSLLATTSYAHFEKLREMDTAVGADKFVKWPLTIGLQAHMFERGRPMTSNAIYDGRFDALFIVPYTESALPIAMNAGILAHEHFHSLFQNMVLGPMKEKSVVVGKPGIEHAGCHGGAHIFGVTKAAENLEQEDGGSLSIEEENELREQAANEIPKPVYNAFVLRGLNEGLADFWGWVYSGDVSFVGRSLPSQDRSRRIDAHPGQLATELRVRRSLVDLDRNDKMIPEEHRVKMSYMLGTQYARFLREIAVEMADGQEPDFVTRMTLARAVLQSIPMIAENSAKVYDSDYISTDFILKPLILNLPRVTDGICVRVRKFIPVENGFQVPAACAKTPVNAGAPSPAETPVIEQTPPLEQAPVVEPAPPVEHKPAAEVRS